VSKSNGIKRRNLRHVALGIVIIILLLITYAMAGTYINTEIYSREEKIEQSNNQVSILQELIKQNKPQIEEITQKIANLSETVNTLNYENKELTELTQTKQYQLMLAWHEIYVLRNQTARLESQITELEAQIEASQSAAIPAGLP